MKRRAFNQLIATIPAAGYLAGFSSSAHAATRLKFDSYVSEAAGPSQIDSWFLDEWARRCGDAIDIKRYWSASLNKVGEHLAAVRDGTSEISLISPGYYQSELPVTRGLEWYFRMHHADALQKVCRDVYKEFAPLREEWEVRHRSKVLYWTNWVYAPVISRKPIKSIEDFKGMRIRSYGVASEVIEKLGGTAVPMAAPEVYTALERGVLDGVYGFDFMTAVAYQLHEVAPHMLDIGDGPHAPAAVIINRDTWESLPDDVRKVADDLADEIYNQEYDNIISNYMQQYVKKALAAGVTFSRLSAEEMEEARTRVQPAQVDRWITDVAKPNGIDGEAMQQLIEQAIKRYDPEGRLLRPYDVAQQLG